MTDDTTRLVLVRHGAVHADWNKRIYGSLDVPLSDAGRRESKRAAGTVLRLKPDWVISSGLGRAEDTAFQLRAVSGQERCDDWGLRELDRGEWAGLTVEDVERRYPGAWGDWSRGPALYRPPNGESLIDLSARVLPRVAHWAGAFPGGTVAIVTHGWVLRVLISHALALGLDLAIRIDVRTGDVILIRWPHRATSHEAVLESFALDQDTSVQFSD